MKLHHRSILITGGTSGIGLELARQLLEHGNTIIVTGRDQVRLDATVRELPGLHAYRSDVSYPAEIQQLYQDMLAAFPTLDTLINNAGIMRNLNLDQPHDLTDMTREVEIDLMGPIQMVQQFLPHLKTRPDALIVNVSSGLAFIPLTTSPVYSAAKAGLHAYTQALRQQLAGSRVRIVELAPPPIETPLLRGLEAETGGLTSMSAMSPATLVRQTIAGIEAGKTELRPGLSNVLNTMSRVAPQFMFRQMTRMSVPRT
ncbi:SDR family oxidoreductase [Deinococcus alpinitundrae]|uniref:SDR family oxidoreductase n=1 Tax=Deinococcus alpinitundrae TaxID=468913 RepID=UPI001379BCF6|nr:SDR family NAD(P)-dependent oxidoreductase [Deinococcus alpinitundrae]